MREHRESIYQNGTNPRSFLHLIWKRSAIIPEHSASCSCSKWGSILRGHNFSPNQSSFVSQDGENQPPKPPQTASRNTQALEVGHLHPAEEWHRGQVDKEKQDNGHSQRHERLRDKKLDYLYRNEGEERACERRHHRFEEGDCVSTPNREREPEHQFGYPEAEAVSLAPLDFSCSFLGLPSGSRRQAPKALRVCTKVMIRVVRFLEAYRMVCPLRYVVENSV